MDKLSSSSRIEIALHKMGIFSYKDVIAHLPRKYEVFSFTNDRYLKDKQRVVFFGKVISLPIEKQLKKVKIYSFDFKTENGLIFKVNAFNRGYLTSILKIEDEITLVGTYSTFDNAVIFSSFFKGKIENNLIRPIYSLPQTISNFEFINVVKHAFLQLDNEIHSYIPYFYINKYRLLDKKTSYYNVHFPKSLSDAKKGYRILKYEEALLFSLMNQIIREDNRSLLKIKKEPIDLEYSCKEILSILPFNLTNDQKKVAEEIINDMNQEYLMYRLLQGDVGSGKTVVSLLALYANYKRGDQGALMAPTEALAKQHFETIKSLFKDYCPKVALLTGSTSLEEKNRIKRDLADGLIDILIGTHALFSKDIKYSSLGLVVIDEQHRFGVNQRKALLDKGDHCDLLMMSATPIPRSFALTLFGDLDVSTIEEFPNKIRNIKTSIINDDQPRIFSYVKDSLNLGKQVYVVAPLIEGQEYRVSVYELFDIFNKEFPGKVGLLHGKLSNSDKNLVLDKFISNSLPILVSTQVIEVGIDVKNADLMIIYDASNFGLASLHQLRGRIGRDGSKGNCLLISDVESKDSLKILEETNDGFKISEEDMKSRGPGELTGVRQSGIPEFKYLNVIEDINIFVTARNDAKEILKNTDIKANNFICHYVRQKLDTKNEKKDEFLF